LSRGDTGNVGHEIKHVCAQVISPTQLYIHNQIMKIQIIIITIIIATVILILILIVIVLLIIAIVQKLVVARVAQGKR